MIPTLPRNSSHDGNNGRKRGKKEGNEGKETRNGPV